MHDAARLVLALAGSAAGPQPLGGQRPVLIELPSAQVLAAVGAGVAVLFAVYYAVTSNRPDEKGERRPFPAGSVLVSLAIAFALLFFVALDDRFEGKTIPIYSYGFMVMTGFAAAILVASYRAERVGIDRNVILDLGLWTMLAGIVGARVFHMIQFHEHYAGQSFFSFFEVWKGGLVFYGGLVGGAAAGILFLRLRNLSVRRMADVIAPTIALGVAFARFGCFLNGCCYGRACDPDFFLAIQDPKTLEPSTIHPTQLYSSLDAFLIFVIVTLYGAATFRRRAHGEVFLAFVILYAVGRFVMESFRNDTGPVFGTGGTIAQVISVAALAAAVPAFAWLWIRKSAGHARPADSPAEPPAPDDDPSS